MAKIMSFAEVPNFHLLSKEAAQAELDKLLASFKEKKMWISMTGCREIDLCDPSMEPLSVTRIQRAFAELHELVVPAGRYNELDSYTLKHRVEKWQDEYISNGDCIAAMLLKGYKIRAGFPNCEFKMRLLVTPEEIKKRHEQRRADHVKLLDNVRLTEEEKKQLEAQRAASRQRQRACFLYDESKEQEPLRLGISGVTMQTALLERALRDSAVPPQSSSSHLGKRSARS